MIRLAHFVTHPIQYCAPLYQELARQAGVELTVLFGSRFGLAPSFDEGFGQTIQFDVPLLQGYDHVFLNNKGSGVPSHGYGNFDCPEMDRLFKQSQFDAVWIHGWAYKAHWQAFRAARRHGIPYMIRGETNMLLKPKYSLKWFASNILVGRMLRTAAACLYIGQSNRDFYASLGVCATRLLPAHYSVDARRFRDAVGSEADRKRLRQQFGAGPNTFVVVCAAKAIARKRVGDVISAVGGLGHSVHLWIIGDGQLRQELEHKAAREAPGRVVFHGFVNQSRMPELLAAADVFVLPSEAEPWGLVVNEAMAVGLPAVCSDGVGCVADLVRPNETGSVYPVGNVKALTEILGQMVGNRDECRKLGASAQQLILNEYDVAATARQIADAARTVVGRESPILAVDRV